MKSQHSRSEDRLAISPHFAFITHKPGNDGYIRAVDMKMYTCGSTSRLVRAVISEG